MKIMCYLLLVVLSLVAFAFNRDVPYLISGVDQVLKPTLFWVASLLIWTNVFFNIVYSMVAIFTVSAIIIKIRFVLLSLNLLTLGVAIFSVFIDNLDMYAHVGLERAVSNTAVVSLLIFLFARTKNKHFKRV